MKAPFYKQLTRIGTVIFVFGIAIVPCWLVARWIGGSRLAAIEFPLGDPRDVAVDSLGRIYVAESFYGRVQRYSPEGEFQRGWFVPTAGVFALRTTTDGRVLVATARANKLLTYCADGELLSGLYWQDTDRFREFASEQETTGPYVVRRGLLPHIDDTRSGRTVIATSVLKRLISGPFPAAAYAAVGAGMLGAAEWRRRRGSAR